MKTAEEKAFRRFSIKNIDIDLFEQMNAFKLKTKINRSEQIRRALIMYFKIPENKKQIDTENS